MNEWAKRGLLERPSGSDGTNSVNVLGTGQNRLCHQASADWWRIGAVSRLITMWLPLGAVRIRRRGQRSDRRRSRTARASGRRVVRVVRSRVEQGSHNGEELSGGSMSLQARDPRASGRRVVRVVWSRMAQGSHDGGERGDRSMSRQARARQARAPRASGQRMGWCDPRAAGRTRACEQVGVMADLDAAALGGVRPR
jgi:hypothetical protein